MNKIAESLAVVHTCNLLNKKGITLISLIVTIIILLLLAGVTTSILGGDGIIKNSQKAVDMHKVENMREKIQMAIAKKATSSIREITIEQIIEALEEQGIIKEGNSNIETGQVKTEPDGYVYEIKEKENGDFEVIYIGNGELTLPELLITLSPNTTGITNAVTITMTAKDESGITSYTLPNGTEQSVTSGSKEITTTYTATENGTYTFTVTNGNGKTESKSITIDNILEGTIQISANPTTPTKGNVTVTVTWPSDASRAIKEIKVGEGSWQVCTGEVNTVDVMVNCTIKARVRNSVEEIKTATCEIDNIDKTNPTVTAKMETVTITEGDSHSLEEYFTIVANGKYGIASTKYTDTSNGNKVITNTNELSTGTHEIQVMVEKETGAKATATITIIVLVLGYVITFISNGATYTTMKEQLTVKFPEESPTMSNKNFTGWYYDEACTNVATEGTELTSNTTLYAGWKSYVTNKINGEQIEATPKYYDDGHVLPSHPESDYYSGPEMIHEYQGSSEIDYCEATRRPRENRDDDYQTNGIYFEGGKVYHYDIRKYGPHTFETFDITIHFKDGSYDTDFFTVECMCWMCLAEGTLVVLSDKTTKPIEDITYDDELLVWDFDKGCLSTAKPLWIMKKHTADQYNLLKFANGSELKTIDQHRIFNKDMGKFTYPMTDETPIGTTTFTDLEKETKLISKEIIHENVNYYNIITDYHMNLFANGILTSCRLSNLYEIENMKYKKDDRTLAKQEDYPNIPEEYFYGLRIAEQPREINRGNDVKHSKNLEGYVQNLIDTAKPKQG